MYDGVMVAKTYSKRLVLFDAHAIIHRAYHALPDFSTKKGEPTGGLYGLSTMLLRAISEFDPDYMAACYDLPGPTFRHKQYKDYKAGRKKTDDDLKKQLQRSRDIFTALHVPIYDSAGFEADDMIGTIVEQTKNAKDLEVLIVTGDMDTLQLVQGNKVRVYTLKKGITDTVVYDEEKVIERFGFPPQMLPDYKGLRGDPSDNIIGIAGIGEKTGGELIQKFHSIEGIYKALKTGDTLLRDAGIKPRIIELLVQGEEEALFSKMLATIRKDAPITYQLPKKTWKEEFSLDAIIQLFDELEFKSLGARARTLLGVKINEEKVAPEKGLVKEEVVVDPRLFRETQIGLWLLDSERIAPTLEDIFEYTNEKSIEKAHVQICKLLKNENLYELFSQIEIPLLPIIEQAQQHGILVDVDYLKKLSGEYHKMLSQVERSIYKHAGEEFNINSPKQLGSILFDKLGLHAKGLKKTEGGARSTRESELEKLKESHPIIAEILTHREYQKLLSTYIDNIPHLVDETGRVHTTLNQDGSTTGRFSSTNPNLQNIPVREGLGATIRNAFISSPKKVLISFDYSQIEMRVLAMLSMDPGLISIFRDKKDIHTSVAAQVFAVPDSEVTKEMRRKAKVINFGIIYGMGVNALKQNLGTSREEAQQFYEQYFVTFPFIKKYFDQVIENAKKEGYTETLFGRRRQFPNLRSRIPFMKAMAERMAMNAPLQGTAADFVKIAMQKADRRITKENFLGDVALLLQVHDELIYEVSDDSKIIEQAVSMIKEEMESVALDTKGEIIPLVVDVAKGKRWGELENYQ